MTRRDEIEERRKAATPGPWYDDSVQNYGEYGSGDNARSGFKSYAVYDSKGRAIVDTINSDVAEVHEDYGEDSPYAYDAIGSYNANFIAHAPADLAWALAEIDRLRAALVRLGSNEAMTLPFRTRNNSEGNELISRIGFARAALEET